MEEAPAPPQPKALPELAALLPAGIVFVAWMIWISASGGYYPDVWYPSTLVAVSLAVIIVLLGGERLPHTREARVALFAFVALVAFNYLSMLWSDSPGSALDASNLLVLYAAIAWTFAVMPWTPRALTRLFCLWSLGVATFCVVALAQATSATNLDPFFIDGRFSTPMNYPNATAALAVMGMWPALILSARRELPWWLRAACLPVAVFLAEFALLPQSRAALVGLIGTIVVGLIVSSDRLRLLSRMVVVAGGLAISVPRTVAVDDAVTAGRRVAPVLRHAANGMLVTSIAALMIGLLLAWLDPNWGWRRGRARVREDGRASRGTAANGAATGTAAHAAARDAGADDAAPEGRANGAADGVDVRPPATRPRRSRRRRQAMVGVLVLVVVGGAVAAAPPVIHFAKSVVKKGNTDATTGSTRLLSTTPEERFDYARVALKLFSQDSIAGVGAGNFGRHYDALRRFAKHSQYTHDIWLRALSETGIIGFALLLAVLGALALGLLRALRELDGLGRACAAAATTVAAYWLVHASLDWVDEFPALAAPAFAFAMAAIALRRPSRPSRQAGHGAAIAWTRPARIATVAAGSVVLVAVSVALTGPYLSKQYITRALATYKVRPGAAIDDLRRAHRLNPFSADPLTTQGTIELTLDEPSLARASFDASLRKENAWYPRLELALLDAEAGQFAAASQQLDQAAKLDVDDPAIAEARSQINQHKRIDPLVFNRVLLQGAASQFFQRQRIR